MRLTDKAVHDDRGGASVLAWLPHRAWDVIATPFPQEDTILERDPFIRVTADGKTHHRRPSTWRRRRYSLAG